MPIKPVPYLIPFYADYVILYNADGTIAKDEHGYLKSQPVPTDPSTTNPMAEGAD